MCLLWLLWLQGKFWQLFLMYKLYLLKQNTFRWSCYQHYNFCTTIKPGFCAYSRNCYFNKMFHQPLQNTFLRPGKLIVWLFNFSGCSSINMILLVPLNFFPEHLLSFQTELHSHLSPACSSLSLLLTRLLMRKLLMKFFIFIHSPNNRVK